MGEELKENASFENNSFNSLGESILIEMLKEAKNYLTNNNTLIGETHCNVKWIREIKWKCLEANFNSNQIQSCFPVSMLAWLL